MQNEPSEVDPARKSKIVLKYWEAILLIKGIEAINCKIEPILSCKFHGLRPRLQDSGSSPSNSGSSPSRRVSLVTRPFYQHLLSYNPLFSTRLQDTRASPSGSLRSPDVFTFEIKQDTIYEHRQGTMRNPMRDTT